MQRWLKEAEVFTSQQGWLKHAWDWGCIIIPTFLQEAEVTQASCMHPHLMHFLLQGMRLIPYAVAQCTCTPNHSLAASVYIHIYICVCALFEKVEQHDTCCQFNLIKAPASFTWDYAMCIFVQIWGMDWWAYHPWRQQLTYKHIYLWPAIGAT